MFRGFTLVRAFLAVSLAFAALPSARAARGGGRRAPAGFEVLESFDVPAAQRSAIAKRLGARIVSFSHTSFAVHGRSLEMNVIKCSNSEEAAKVHKIILRTKKHDAFCFISDSTVIEFIGQDTNLAILAAFELGFKPRPKMASYKISFRLAPVDKADYTSCKKLSNLFASASADRSNTAFEGRIAMMTGKFRFGNEVVLRAIGGGDAVPSYSFEPSAAKTTPLAGGDMSKYTFRDLPREVNVPFVSVTATIHTAPGAIVPTTRMAGPELLGPTEYWPSDDPEIVSLAAEITARCNSVEEKTQAILKWLKPGANIRFTESITTARSGVKNVLRQKFGQAWDFSDCFITLARASKVPCRQVGGWFFSQSAHLWAEVLHEGSGWRQVETTGGGATGCGIYHIPYTTSEDGPMSFLYMSKPRIEFISN